jgi:hypothetical protein
MGRSMAGGAPLVTRFALAWVPAEVPWGAGISPLDVSAEFAGVQFGDEAI